MYDLLTKIDFTVDVKFVQTYQERHHKDADIIRTPAVSIFCLHC